MTQKEHLNRIVARCRELLAVSEIANCAGPDEAGWRATIAAIKLIQHNKWWHLSYGIIAAWPEELL